MLRFSDRKFQSSQPTESAASDSKGNPRIRIPVIIFNILAVMADFDRVLGQTVLSQRTIYPDMVKKAEIFQSNSFLTSAYDTGDRS
jgi:hypothetical protein